MFYHGVAAMLPYALPLFYGARRRVMQHAATRAQARIPHILLMPIAAVMLHALAR